MSETRARVKITPREKRRHAAGREKNELHTPKSVGREGSKAWALSVVPHFSLSPPRLAFLAWGDFHARSRFARSSIPEENRSLPHVGISCYN